MASNRGQMVSWLQVEVWESGNSESIPNSATDVLDEAFPYSVPQFPHL